MQPDQGLNPTLDLTIGPKGDIPVIDPALVLPVAFTLLCIGWLIYSIVIAYHWVRYGHQSWLAVPALVVYLAGSALIILFAASGLR